jgi:hypothetical protein
VDACAGGYAERFVVAGCDSQQNAAAALHVTDKMAWLIMLRHYRWLSNDHAV